MSWFVVFFIIGMPPHFMDDAPVFHHRTECETFARHYESAAGLKPRSLQCVPLSPS
jgi:hypothetical protein